jgi:hypothetical protein
MDSRIKKEFDALAKSGISFRTVDECEDPLLLIAEAFPDDLPLKNSPEQAYMVGPDAGTELVIVYHPLPEGMFPPESFQVTDLGAVMQVDLGPISYAIHRAYLSFLSQYHSRERPSGIDRVTMQEYYQIKYDY